MISIILPTPPSTNALFANNRRAGGRHITSDYKHWREHAGWLLQREHFKPIPGKVKITLTVEDKGRRDLSNAGLKSIEDLLVTHGLIEGDDRRFVRGITLGWSESVTGVAVTVEGMR